MLGRMLDVLEGKNYSVRAIAIDGGSEILDGNPTLPSKVDVPILFIIECLKVAAGTHVSRR